MRKITYAIPVLVILVATPTAAVAFIILVVIQEVAVPGVDLDAAAADLTGSGTLHFTFQHLTGLPIVDDLQLLRATDRFDLDLR